MGLIEELSKIKVEVEICAGNKSLAKLAKNQIFHNRPRHINVHYHDIISFVECKEVVIEHVLTQGQLADVMTMSLGKLFFSDLRES